jgi:hypothetical protein
MSLRLPTKSIARMSAAIGLATGLTVVLGACQISIGDTKEKALHRAAEKAISDVMSTKGFGPLAPSCETPKIGRTSEGDTFACDATNRFGKVVTFTATVNGDNVDVVTTNVISVARLRALEVLAVDELEDKVGQTLGIENFTCGDEPIVYELNAPIACTLTDPKSGHRVDATMRVDSFSDDVHLKVKVGASAATN